MAEECAHTADADLIDFVSVLSGEAVQKQRMKNPWKLAQILFATSLLAIAGSTAALADDSDDDDDDREGICEIDDDHDRALLAVTGEGILPLAEILKLLGPQIGSALIEVEFECEDIGYVYIFEVRLPNGRIVELTINAVTGEIVPSDDD